MVITVKGKRIKIAGKELVKRNQKKKVNFRNQPKNQRLMKSLEKSA